MKMILLSLLLALGSAVAFACPDTPVPANALDQTVVFTITGPDFSHHVSATFPSADEAAKALVAGFGVGKILIDWPAHAHTATTAGDAATVTLIAASSAQTEQYSATFLTVDVAKLTATRVCKAIEASMITK